MLNLITTSISNVYSRLTLIHPDYWFSARSEASLWSLYGYWILVWLLLLLSCLFFFKSLRSRQKPFRKRFFTKLTWFGLFFSLVAVSLSLFRAYGVPLLSARAVWIPFFLAIAYFAYTSLIEF